MQRVRFCVIASFLLFTTTGYAQPDAGDYSPVKHEVIEELDASAPMRDGISLKIDIFRPRDEGKYPAILLTTPYGKGRYGERAKNFASRGYVVINADVRGRFESGGEWDPFTPLHKQDGYDLVEWIAAQPWCSGKVGMYGSSYMGWTQWWTATQAPPSLKAIVPEVAPPDHFHNCPYQNGILVCWMVDYGGMMGGRYPQSHPEGDGPYGGWGRHREEEYRMVPYIDYDKTRHYLPTTWWRKWMLQNTASGEYWKQIAYQTREDYSRITVPSLSVTGWFDANFPGAPMNFMAMKKYGATPEARQPRMVVGPWDHGINTNVVGIDYGPQAIIDWDGYVCRWFDHHLKGIDNGVMEDPPVQLFVTGRNQWRAATDWPLPETEFTKFYLHSGGHANSLHGDGSLSREIPASETPDQYTYNPDDPTPSAPSLNGHIDGPRDINESAKRNDVLVYTTDPLTEDVELTGPITAKLFAATSARDTDWMVRLCEVFPDGRTHFIGEGVMRARHRDPQKNGAFNPDKLSVIEPDQPYEYTIEFWRPTANLFARGQRIRIEISSSYYPYYLRNLNSGEENANLATTPVIARQTIYHDAEHPSHVIFPVIPAGK
ncbi:CocE/NonD family hydrolase [Planctomicrobium sp. SH661]|uniref:CocE/NonD family hydrolase n=1 Tax=Planctomicrobium sp. SH661 TaxID=3448124 RepID=UPI003F5BD3A8